MISPHTRPSRYLAPLRPLLLAAAVGASALGASALGGCASKPEMPATRPVNLKPAELPAGSFSTQVPIDLKLPEGDSLAAVYLAGGRMYAVSRGNLAFGLTPGGTPTFVRRLAEEGETVYPPVMTQDTPTLPNAPAPDAELVFPTATALDVYKPDGTPVRSVTTGFSIRSHVASGLGLIYGGIDTPLGGRVGAFDPDREFANLRWSVQQGAVRAGPAFFGRVVYFGTVDGRVYSVSPDQSTPWAGLPDRSFQTDAEIVADLYADEFAVYVASTDKKLYALDRPTGKVRWYYFAQAPLTDAPVVTADAVYQVVAKVGMVKIDKVKGEIYRKPVWMARGVSQFLSEDAQNVYARKPDGTLLALDRASGQVKFSARLPFNRLYATNTADGTIYSADRAGRVTIIHPVLKAGQIGLPLEAVK